MEEETGNINIVLIVKPQVWRPLL